MGWVLGLGNGVVFRQGGGSGLGSSYWTPSSAVVENADPTDVVLTYAKAVKPADAIAGNFTIAGKTISGAVLDGTGKILTLTVTVAFVYGDSITVVANGTNISVTNNINAEAELTTYITGLTTPLSSAQLLRLNTLIKSIKTGLSISALSEAFDTLYVLAGETSESSLKNLVKDAHHCTAVNAPTFTQYEGYGGGATKSLNTNYNPFAQGENYLLNSASLGAYVRTTTIGDYAILGVSDAIGNESYIKPRTNYDTVGRLFCRVNQATYTFKPATGDTKGMLIVSRVGANAVDGYKNGTDLNCSGNTEVSTSLQNYNIHLLALKSRKHTVNHSPDQLSIAFMGKGFSGAEITAITNACEAYMDALGKGVV